MDKRKRRLLCMLEGGGRKSRWVSGAPPLSFKAKKAGTLENYRIYGNTVGGESVGDKTENLFGSELVLGSFLANTGEYTFVTTRCISDFINVKPNTAYSLRITGALIRYIGYYGEAFSYISPLIADDFTFITPNDCNQIRIVFSNYNGSTQVDLTVFPKNTIMLNEGSTPLPYEPYGYKVTVTVSNDTDTLATTIYLPEQIKKVGDVAEYIDYGEQKMHRIGADDIDVTLPALPTLTGTNVLRVGTAVQPSKIEVKGKIKAL